MAATALQPQSNGTNRTSSKDSANVMKRYAGLSLLNRRLPPYSIPQKHSQTNTLTDCKANS